jgi:hypothetical protein
MRAISNMCFFEPSNKVTIKLLLRCALAALRRVAPFNGLFAIQHR